MQPRMLFLLVLPLVAFLSAGAGPVYSEGYDWNGYYAAASLGLAMEDGDDPAPSIGLGGTREYMRLSSGSLLITGAEFDYSETLIGTPVQDIDKMYRLKGRLGVTAGDNMVYAVAGAVLAQGGFGDSWGYLAGAGVEHVLREKVTIAGEFVYHHFSDFADTGQGLGVNTLSARLTYRF